jgi:hypothetical protein
MADDDPTTALRAGRHRTDAGGERDEQRHEELQIGQPAGWGAGQRAQSPDQPHRAVICDPPDADKVRAYYEAGT